MRGVRPVVLVAIIPALVASATFAQIEPLSSATVGYSPQTVTPPGSYSIDIDGDMNLGGFVFKDGYPFIHNDGGAFGAAAYNTAIGLDALSATTPGAPSFGAGKWNTASGAKALRGNTSGTGNTATGALALVYSTTSSHNTATGATSLRSNLFSSDNTATGYGALSHNNTGSYNTATGVYALESVSYNSGSYNTATGADALRYNVTGSYNTATGWRALSHNSSGGGNVAIGGQALLFNTTGNGNTAVGTGALLQNIGGIGNTALGWSAGSNGSAGSSNVWIANYGAEESNTLRIGNGTGTGYFQQTRAFISGIANAAGGTFAQAVCVDNSTDQLGPCSASSTRFKEDVADLEADSEAVLDLRPVRFRYKEAFVGEGQERPLQYGLIAEEVAEIYPQLVTYDAEGQPITVRYEALAPLLLNELKKERARNARQESQIERLMALEETVRKQSARLARLESGVAPGEPPRATARR